MNCAVCHKPDAIPTLCECLGLAAHPGCIAENNSIRCSTCKGQYHGTFAVELGRLCLEKGVIHPTILHTMIGDALLSTHKYSDAIKEYTIALRTPHILTPAIHAKLATAYASAGYFNTAVRIIEEAHNNFPEDPSVQERLCFIYTISGFPERAVDLYNKFPSDSLERRLNLALTHKKMKQYGEARKIYDVVIPQLVAKYGASHPNTLRVKKIYYTMVVLDEENYDSSIIPRLEEFLKVARECDVCVIKKMIAYATFTKVDPCLGINLFKELVPERISTKAECSATIDVACMLKRMEAPYRHILKRAEIWGKTNDPKLYKTCRRMLLWEGDVHEAEANLSTDPEWVSLIYYATLLKQKSEFLFKKGMALCPEPETHPSRSRLRRMYKESLIERNDE